MSNNRLCNDLFIKTTTPSDIPQIFIVHTDINNFEIALINLIIH